MFTKISLLLLFLFSFNGYSQMVKIEGYALDTTTQNRSYVHITINDTLTKFRKKAKVTKKWDDYDALIKNENLVQNAHYPGYFCFSAKVTDSLFFSSDLYLTQKYAVSDLMKRKEINIQLEPEICIQYIPCEQKKPSKTFAFIGKKIKIEGQKIPYYCNVVMMDSETKSTYKIEENIYGKFPKDSITFTAYDHYGFPKFSKYEYALLFVSEYCDELIHEKYQYFDVYKTKNGKWASPGNPYKYDSEIKDKSIKAKKMTFEDTVWFDISKLNPEQIKDEFPAAYYKIVDNKAIPIMGTYVKDLVEIKKNGVLKARNIELK